MTERQVKILSQVPKEYREGTLKLAYQLGHAYGEEEVNMYLHQIIECIFKK